MRASSKALGRMWGRARRDGLEVNNYLSEPLTSPPRTKRSKLRSSRCKGIDGIYGRCSACQMLRIRFSEPRTPRAAAMKLAYIAVRSMLHKPVRAIPRPYFAMQRLYLVVACT